jgi:hypothetical protein
MGCRCWMPAEGVQKGVGCPWMCVCVRTQRQQAGMQENETAVGCPVVHKEYATIMTATPRWDLWAAADCWAAHMLLEV